MKEPSDQPRFGMDAVAFFLEAIITANMGEHLTRDLVEGWLEILCEKVMEELEETGRFAGPRQ